MLEPTISDVKLRTNVVRKSDAESPLISDHIRIGHLNVFVAEIFQYGITDVTPAMIMAASTRQHHEGFVEPMLAR